MYCGRELFQLSPIGEARQPMEPWQEQGRQQPQRRGRERKTPDSVACAIRAHLTVARSHSAFDPDQELIGIAPGAKATGDEYPGACRRRRWDMGKIEKLASPLFVPPCNELSCYLIIERGQNDVAIGQKEARGLWERAKGLKELFGSVKALDPGE